MNPIIQALASGYGVNKILQYLSQSSPSLANKVTTALAYGYPATEVLKYVMKGGKSLDKDLPNASSADINLYEQMGNLPEDVKDAAQVGLGIAGAGLALGLGSRLGQGANAAQAAANASAPNVPAPNAPAANFPPNTGLNPIGPPPTAPQGGTIGNITPGQAIANQAQAPVQQAMQPTNPAQVAQAAQAAPTQTPIFNQLLGGIDPATLSTPQQEQLKFLAMISDELESKGKNINDPEFKNVAKKIKKILQGQPGTVIEETARFNANQQAAEASKPKVSIVDPTPIKNPKELEKGSSVMTEDGNIAEVKGISGNNFLIQENGKVRLAPMDTLRAEPEAIKNAKIVFDPSTVPEEDRSAALAISVPMPDRSSIINMFHDGSFYVYRRKDGKPLDESIISRVIEGQDIPITTGETFMGAWNPEKGDSRGSAAHKELVSMSQSIDDFSKQDDPGKPLVFEKLSKTYTHGYLKEFQKLLKQADRNFRAKPKKPKK